MLNRLIFVYFMQRKDFLDGDRDSLRNRLHQCRRERGEDRFYSFYRYFLLRLFHEGLGGRERSPELEMLLGRILYDIQDRFPQATHILDYFHAVEKLAEFARMMFPDETRRQRWLEGQEAELAAGNVAQVLETLDKLVPLTQTAQEAREALNTTRLPTNAN